MSVIHEMAETIRATDAIKALDARAIAAGLIDTAAVCAPEQRALAERLSLAANKLLQMSDALEKGIATLHGVRNMAATEAHKGSVAWCRTIQMIDACVKVMR